MTADPPTDEVLALLRAVVEVRERMYHRTIEAGEAPDVADEYLLLLLLAQVDVARYAKESSP